MIIVEGPDGSGKSTLVKTLSERLSLPVRDWPGIAREDMPNRGVKQRVFQSLSEALRFRSDDPVYIHDRLYWSEIVYGKTLRGSIAFSKQERTAIRDTIDAWGFPVIFCLPQFEVVERNVKASAQLEKVPEFIETIYDDYSRIYSGIRSQGLNCCRYDYTGELQPTTSIEAIVRRCQSWINRREEYLWSSSTTRTSQRV